MYMKKLLPYLSALLLVAACQTNWMQSDKDAFFEACVDDANSWTGNPAKSKQYCECVIIKVTEKYPDVNEALENIETISRDPDIQKCRIPILK